MNESTRRLVRKDEPHVPRKLEVIGFESAGVVRLLELPNNKDVLPLKGADWSCDLPVNEEVQLAFLLLELIRGRGGVELVLCVGQETILQ